MNPAAVANGRQIAGCFPLDPREPRVAWCEGGVTRHAFRRGMRRLGAAVSIVATDGPAGRCGFTASAVCPVTDAPPMILVCMNRASAMNAAFKGNAAFCVNTLASGQEALSDAFAGIGGACMGTRFAGARWDTLVTGSPALLGGLVSFDCRLSDVNEVGTHTVMFGLIEAVRLNGENRALIHANRRYHAVELGLE